MAKTEATLPEPAVTMAEPETIPMCLEADQGDTEAADAAAAAKGE